MGRMQYPIVWVLGLTAVCLLALNNMDRQALKGNFDLGGLFVRNSGFGSADPRARSLRFPNPTANLTEYQLELLSCTGFIPSKANPKIENLTRLREQLLLPQLDFLPYYKNPCFEDKGKIRCLPYFYVAGQPKCGTTDLHSALRQHQNISLAGQKEPWWWTGRRLGHRSQAARWYPLQEYLSVFQRSAEEIKNISVNGYHPAITGDFSTTYFTGNDRWPLYPGNEGLREPKYIGAHFIKSLTPHAKIIVSLRNPVDRLYSHYFENAKQLDFTLSPEGFHEAAVEAVAIMRECISARGVRECLHDACVNSLDTMKVRLRDSMYSIFLKDWLKVFPREQVLIVSFEEYAADRATVATNIFDFLGTGPVSKTTLAGVNSLSVHNKRWPKHRVGPMLNKTRNLLQDFLRPFNGELLDILKDDRFRFNRD